MILQDLWKRVGRVIGIAVTGEPDIAVPDLTVRKSEEVVMSSSRDQVFISYSHADDKWLKELRIRLEPYVRSTAITVWDDTMQSGRGQSGRIASGRHWPPQRSLCCW